jgi:hypothetical protein
MGRFDYVKYDDISNVAQKEFKKQVEIMEDIIVREMNPGRAQSLAMTKLEEFYMWIGKAIRDDQIARSGGAELQEERKNG